MTDWQFWVLLAAIVANGYFAERRLDAIRKQNVLLIQRLVLRE